MSLASEENAMAMAVMLGGDCNDVMKR